MRKVFLASTALVALTSVASAADITFSGDTVFNYTSISDTTAFGAGKDGNAMSVDGNFSVSSTATSDSGLTYTTAYDVDGDSADLSISGDFGKLSIDGGSDGAGASGEMSGDVAADETTGITTIPFDGDSAVPGGMLSYSSPSIGGLNVYVGYTDDGATNDNATTSYSFKYATEAAGASVTLGYAASSADTAETDTSSMGAKISSGDIALTAALNTMTVGTTADYSGTSVGLTYTVSDAMAVQMHQKNAEDDKDATYDYSESAISATYTIAPGLTSAITYTSYELTDGGTKQDGSATNVELKVAF
jgi:hypothetical protein